MTTAPAARLRAGVDVLYPVSQTPRLKGIQSMKEVGPCFS